MRISFQVVVYILCLCFSQQPNLKIEYFVEPIESAFVTIHIYYVELEPGFAEISQT